MRFLPRTAILILLIAVPLILYFSGVLKGYDLPWLSERQSALKELAGERLLFYSTCFFLGYVAVTAFSLPGAALMTIGAGAVFGFPLALLLVSFASSIGATLAFLMARYVFLEWAEKRFGQKFQEIKTGFEADGLGYLALARLSPLFPFFLVNLAFGLTKIPTWKFYLVSQLAMLPGTAIYVNAGEGLSRVREISDIFSPRLVIAFTLLGFFPIAVKKAAARWKERYAQ